MRDVPSGAILIPIDERRLQNMLWHAQFIKHTKHGSSKLSLFVALTAVSCHDQEE
ncbi:MAG: hypothetical protein SVY53_01350 [Chloroflexota bacterium]|nr:hypothetical protein [Chloroflexota bacterium]